MNTDTTVAVVVPNLNGEAYLSSAIDSLLAQDYAATIIVVENASTDRSIEILESYGDKITVLKNDKNLGFAGGVNTGITYALERDFNAIALFNNDAIADPKWLSKLVDALSRYDDAGIITGRIQLADGTTLDSTGEFYTSWGLPYPRGRDEPVDKYLSEEYVFGASGGASIYRAAMLNEIGIFDDAYFAYYEDTDISFRAQLAGWKIVFTPGAIVNHRQGETSKKMVRGFTVTQTFKNLPMLFLKNVPAGLLLPIGVRFFAGYGLILAKALIGGNAIPALKGVGKGILLLPHTLSARRTIQRQRKVSTSYIKSLIVYDLPPNQTGIRRLRKILFRR